MNKAIIDNDVLSAKAEIEKSMPPLPKENPNTRVW